MIQVWVRVLGLERWQGQRKGDETTHGCAYADIDQTDRRANKQTDSNTKANPSPNQTEACIYEDINWTDRQTNRLTVTLRPTVALTRQTEEPNWQTITHVGLESLKRRHPFLALLMSCVVL
jgi:hypothetical protein